MAIILGTPTNEQLFKSLSSIRQDVQNQMAIVHSMQAEEGEPKPVITEEEMAKKRNKLKTLLAIHGRRTKLAKNMWKTIQDNTQDKGLEVSFIFIGFSFIILLTTGIRVNWALNGI